MPRKIEYCSACHSSEDFAHSFFGDGGHESAYSAKLKNDIKQDWEYDLGGIEVALKEIKDFRYDLAEFLKTTACCLRRSYEKNLVHCDLHIQSTTSDDITYDIEFYGIIDEEKEIQNQKSNESTTLESILL
ncbi:hypothetical protein Glove_117g371 [Diversispora epigaea]|uniref:Uncharacterized protein n=1 Tax=Diversispora epigaea TaxID=1348612 RepID=A0A397J372_9GLOM|nr:hypothetical protein Glove_117g371 [Diversispora epigaea]